LFIKILFYKKIVLLVCFLGVEGILLYILSHVSRTGYVCMYGMRAAMGASCNSDFVCAGVAVGTTRCVLQQRANDDDRIDAAISVSGPERAEQAITAASSRIGRFHLPGPGHDERVSF
jgi:hypothetical protein